jgi:hypothetical protein
MGFMGWNRSKEVCAMPLNTLESNHKLGSAEVQSAPSPWINKQLLSESAVHVNAERDPLWAGALAMGFRFSRVAGWGWVAESGGCVARCARPLEKFAPVSWMQAYIAKCHLRCASGGRHVWSWCGRLDSKSLARVSSAFSFHQDAVCSMCFGGIELPVARRPHLLVSRR